MPQQPHAARGAEGPRERAPAYHPPISVRVPLNELDDQIESFGPYAYLLTVGTDARPKATSTTVMWHEDGLVASAGKRTAENASKNDQVTLLWPSPNPGGYALLADGLATVREDPDGRPAILVVPTSAVLHVTAPARG